MRLSSSQIEAIKQETEHCFGAQAEVRLFGSCEDKHQRGFTLVELIMTMVIIGIISAVAIPRFFDNNVFQSRGFADEVKASLRFAQKVAIAQHRFVCVAFTTNRTITLTYDPISPSAAHATATCPGSNLTDLAGQTPYTVTSPSADVTLSGYAGFNFDALGRPSFASQQSISIAGATNPVLVEAETGYVH